MTERVSAEESAMITRLIGTGLGRVEARVLTLLAARSYVRPLPDLVATLQHYAELEDSRTTEAAVGNLLTMGLLTCFTTVLGNDLVAPAADIVQQIASLVGDQSLEDQIRTLRRQSAANIDVIGPLRDAASYEGYAERLREAQNDIRMPMVMTDPDALQTVAILKARATAGVKVRILGASPRVVDKLRGAAQVEIANARIKAWHRIARASKNIEYRLTDYEEDMLFATSILIDGEVLRLVLHDPFNERSKEGLVVEVGGRSQVRGVNLVRDFAARFDLAWRHARRPGCVNRVLDAGRMSWQFGLSVILFGLTYTTADPNAGLGRMAGPSWQPVIFNLALPAASALLAAWFQQTWMRRRERHALASVE